MLRRLLAYNKSFNCVDVQIGDAALLYKGTNKKGMARRRGPELISDIDETGVRVKVQAQTFRAARFRMRKKVRAKAVVDARLDPLCVRLKSVEPDLGDKEGRLDTQAGLHAGEEAGDCTFSTGAPDSGSGAGFPIFISAVSLSARPLRAASGLCVLLR